MSDLFITSDGAKSGNPFNQLNLKVVKDVVAKAIEELPERQRLVLSLYYFEDLNLKEIGQEIDVQVSGVGDSKKDIRRGLNVPESQHHQARDL